MWGDYREVAKNQFYGQPSTNIKHIWCKAVVNMNIKRCEREHGIVLGYQTHETVRLGTSIKAK
jgi:hypothetical protein